MIEQLTAEVRALKEQVDRLTAAIMAMGPIKTVGLPGVPSLLTVPMSARRRVDDIRALVAEECDVHPDCILAKERHLSVIWPRHTAMAMARIFSNLCYEQIGTLMGGRDHGTIRYGCQNFVAFIEQDPLRRETARRILSRLTNTFGHPNWLKIGGLPKCLKIDRAA